MQGKTIQKHSKVRINSDTDGILNYMKKTGAFKKKCEATYIG
jgi:hypothetical protein